MIDVIYEVLLSVASLAEQTLALSYFPTTVIPRKYQNKENSYKMFSQRVLLNSFKFHFRKTPYNKVWNANFKRLISTDIKKADALLGETNSTVIEKSKEETLLYFDNVYPRANLFSWYDFLSFKSTDASVRDRIVSYAGNIEMTEMIPMKRDGGCFAKFSVPPDAKISDINATIMANTREKNKRKIFSQVSCFPTKGIPLIEDMQRLPSKTLVVKYDGFLKEEDLYSLFRRYGQIVDIIPETNQSTIKFKSLKGSVCAKNCVNGFTISGCTLNIHFAKNSSSHVIQNFFFNHTRLAIPFVFALISIIALLIFDPIRELMVELKISKKYEFYYSYYNALVSFFSSNSEKIDDGLYHSEIEDFQLWLEENNNTFVVIRGPRGSGKHNLVRHALADRKNVLELNCDSLVKTRIDSRFLRNASSQLGYYPIFPWLNSFVGIIDLGVQSLTGAKSGLSESNEKQFNTMLATAMISIKRLALSDFQSGNEEDYLQQHPEAKPVIVIDRFNNKSDINSFVYKELAEWAALLVQMNIAHVVFLTEAVSPVKLLTDALPNQVFKNMVLSDASNEISRKYVYSNLNTEIDSKCIEPLGGRMLDLQGFVRRVKSGEHPEEALEKMIIQGTEQITQMFLSNPSIRSAQAWELIELLSDAGSLNFKDIVFRPIFKGDPETALLELERDGLITISRDRGMLDVIKPAKPLFQYSFKNLVSDEKSSRILKTSYYLQIIAFETKRILKWEEELKAFKEQNEKLFKSRLTYLSNKIQLSSDVIDNAEASIKKLSA